MTAVPQVAVVGHTNTGKTSLLRTLTRDPDFGEVSNRPATTRGVMPASLTVDGRLLMELYDTPGLEDPMSLLDLLLEAHDRRSDWVETLQKVLASEAAAPFAQEAVALGQVMAADLALYVIDARDPVLGKYRDELEILSRCAVPLLPVLNFVASPEAQVGLWQTQLARLNLHLCALFDTVVLDLENERQLFDKMRSLLHRHEAAFAPLIQNLSARRSQIRRAAGDVIADLLVDAAAYRLLAPSQEEASSSARANLRDALRQREQLCVESLLQLHNFRPDDVVAQTLPLVEGRWAKLCAVSIESWIPRISVLKG